MGKVERRDDDREDPRALDLLRCEIQNDRRNQGEAVCGNGIGALRRHPTHAPTADEPDDDAAHDSQHEGNAHVDQRDAPGDRRNERDPQHRETGAVVHETLTLKHGNEPARQ
ncbi:unannotated protein [freshwater metagenome]|uniref:Unannotated protein n=1 Tax=freshwater metagenome TaxID=449393 RepID=A0A6J7NGC3_9ZZZZ